jgi:4-alpha-glucanotransferase
VVGEDLGTVEDEARAALMEHAILSYRLLWFEEGRTADFPTRALASITTHDLPTVAGVWTGADLGERRAIGRDDDGSDVAHYRQKLMGATGLAPSAPLHAVILDAHRALAQTPSLVVLATLDDAIGAPLRPNIPGTVDERPNWRLPLPATIEELERHPLAAAVAATLDAGVRGEAAPGPGDGG